MEDNRIYDELLVDLVREYFSEHSDTRYKDIEVNEVVFDVANICGHDYRYVISRWLRVLRDDGYVESFSIWGMGEGMALFSERGMLKVKEIKKTMQDASHDAKR